MRIRSLHTAGRYDCLFVSPHPGDASLACAGRMHWEVRRGMRVVIAVVCAGASDTCETSGPLEHLGIDELQLDVPPAPRRFARHVSFASVLHGRGPDDEEQLRALRRMLNQVILHTQVRHIYLPLGVGGHLDHRLVHDAGGLAVPESPGREVFFYEDRPYALLPGAVWIRLGQLGARLPPAVRSAEGSGLLPYLVRFQMAPYVRAHAPGLFDRLRSGRAAARQWWGARGWHPRRACGPRLQPIEHTLDAGACDLVRDLVHEHARLPLCTSQRPALRRPGAAGRLKRREASERYWLLLPPLERDLTLPPAGSLGADATDGAALT